MKGKNGFTAFVLIIALLFAVLVFAGSQTTSSSTASDFITQVRYYLNESTASFWEDAEILQWLSDGQVDIATRTGCLETTETETLQTSTTSYSLTTNFVTVKGAIYNSNKSLQKGSIEHMGMTKAVGEPAYWFTWANNLIVYPSPESGVSGYAVVVYLTTRPTALTATTDSIVVPAQYDKALVLYAVAQALMKDKKPSEAAQIMALYYAELDRFRADTVEQKPLEKVK